MALSASPAGGRDDETLRVLEFDKVTSLLAGCTVTGPGRERAATLRPLDDPQSVADSLTEISEMVALLAEHGPPPVGGCRDLREALRRLRAEGTWLPPETLLEVLSSLEAARDCRSYFAVEDSVHLSGRAELLADLRELRKGLRASLGPRGEVLDGASAALGEVRRGVLRQRARIRATLERMLASDTLAGAFQDRIVTERDGRYVVPVRADHRGQVKGFVHDESASGQTLYVEPAAVLEANNELRALLREEQREVERILRRLSDAVRRQAAELLANQELLAHLDFVAAAGRFSRLCDGIAPQLAPEPLLELREARHPLLLVHPDGRPRTEGAVPIDLLLGEGHDTLVVSGPNTGGKTVALKTAGLLLNMVRAGLHIPCAAGSRVHLFRQVFADIGDEQSIEASLSTFSGHLVRVREILGRADGDSLVLLDEAGTGTDPAEGGALAMAVLDTLRGRGVRTIVTTHLNLVKGYAHLREGVVNAAVEFDEQTLAPTYRLHYGIPGASNAFTIARQLGLPGEVLEVASGYLGEGEREGLQLVEELNRLSRELQRDREEARTLRERARQERSRRKQLLDELEEQKRTILEKATRQGERLVRGAEEKLKALLREAQDVSAKTAEKARIAGEVRLVRESLAPAPARVSSGRVPVETRVGEILRIAALGIEGEVVRVQGSEVELLVHGKKMRQPLSALQAFSPRRFAVKAKGRPALRSRVERERTESRLLLVGKRVDEVLPLLDRFLDDALLGGLRDVEIVHGAGEGVLRRVVRDFLGQHRGVTAFHAGAAGQGGDNVTIAELRE